jgi:hypothetical protein
MRWTGHVARMREITILYKLYIVKPEIRYNLEHVFVNMRLILN